MFVMLVASMTVLSKLNTWMLYLVGCPMYMVSECNSTFDDHLVLKYRTIKMCELLAHKVNCLFAQRLNEVHCVVCGFLV